MSLHSPPAGRHACNTPEALTESPHFSPSPSASSQHEPYNSAETLSEFPHFPPIPSSPLENATPDPLTEIKHLLHNTVSILQQSLDDVVRDVNITFHERIDRLVERLDDLEVMLAQVEKEVAEGAALMVLQRQMGELQSQVFRRLDSLQSVLSDIHVAHGRFSKEGSVEGSNGFRTLTTDGEFWDSQLRPSLSQHMRLEGYFLSESQLVAIINSSLKDDPRAPKIPRAPDPPGHRKLIQYSEEWDKIYQELLPKMKKHMSNRRSDINRRLRDGLQKSYNWDCGSSELQSIRLREKVQQYLTTWPEDGGHGTKWENLLSSLFGKDPWIAEETYAKAVVMYLVLEKTSKIQNSSRLEALVDEVDAGEHESLLWPSSSDGACV